MAGKTVFLLRDKRTKQFVRHANGKLAIYSEWSLADSRRTDWNTRFNTGKQVLEVVEVEVAVDFKIHNYGRK